MLAKEEALRNHREMWNWIADYMDKIPDGYNGECVENLKRDYCYDKNIEILDDCFLCEYTRGICENCPVIWGTENRTDKFFCCYAHYPYDRYYNGLYTRVTSLEYIITGEIIRKEEKKCIR